MIFEFFTLISVPVVFFGGIAMTAVTVIAFVLKFAFYIAGLINPWIYIFIASVVAIRKVLLFASLKFDELV